MRTSAPQSVTHSIRVELMYLIYSYKPASSLASPTSSLEPPTSILAPPSSSLPPPTSSLAPADIDLGTSELDLGPNLELGAPDLALAQVYCKQHQHSFSSLNLSHYYCFMMKRWRTGSKTTTWAIQHGMCNNPRTAIQTSHACGALQTLWQQMMSYFMVRLYVASKNVYIRCWY